MSALALLIPPLLLVLVVLMDHYEERLLRSPGRPRHARERHLRLLPPPAEAERGGPVRTVDRAA
ncbi:hypothetical protein [Streptomyces sp. B1I3]|uniref:hypothetical protein n=1 Tax=Streptomyces sp. B1I3 TaxID=3042264 RepID=UPI00278388E2|nr:hypothetical protein [Streptomyces sp. B1I3]MDQ0792542.1 hypothetical protein [Streptomyces sp. B1I3]